VTTAWVHILPSWLVHATRWGSPASRIGALSTYPGNFGGSDYAHAFVGYALWQEAYFWKTEVLDSLYLDSDRTMQTSLRWLALDTERPIHQLVLGITRRLGLMRPDEVFDPTTTKTKETAGTPFFPPSSSSSFLLLSSFSTQPPPLAYP
jgi:hypothetical protein